MLVCHNWCQEGNKVFSGLNASKLLGSLCKSNQYYVWLDGWCTAAHDELCVFWGLARGAEEIMIWKYASRAWVGAEAAWHPCILPQVMGKTHGRGWRWRWGSMFRILEYLDVSPACCANRVAHLLTQMAPGFNCLYGICSQLQKKRQTLGSPPTRGGHTSETCREKPTQTRGKRFMTTRPCLTSLGQVWSYDCEVTAPANEPPCCPPTPILHRKCTQ